MLKKIFLAALLIQASSQLIAQVQKPVKWSFSHEKSGDTTLLKFTATIDNHWHLYAQHQETDEGPIPTSFLFREKGNTQLIGSVAEPQYIVEEDPNFQLKVHYYNNQVTFIQKAIVPAGTKIKGAVEFMCCNGETCLPPTEEEFSFSL